MGHTKETRKIAYDKIRLRRIEWFSKNGPCSKCGSLDRLELDHVDPKDKIHHCIWSWSEERREAELSKCQVLCHNCHLEKSISETKSRKCPPHINRKFSNEEVLDIKKKINDGAGVRMLARKYGVNHSIISDIINGKTYKEVA